MTARVGPLAALLLLAALLSPATLVAPAAAAAAAVAATPLRRPHHAPNRRPHRALLQTFFGGGANGADTNGMFEEFGGGMRNSAFAEGYPGVQSDTGATAAPRGPPFGLPDSSAGFEWPTRVVGGGLVVPAAAVPSGAIACGTVGLAYEDVGC
jgi:hypothetical protein